jgi:HlyD family secretion protein
MDIKTDPRFVRFAPVFVERLRGLIRSAVAAPLRIPAALRRALIIWAMAFAALAIFLAWTFWPRAMVVDVAVVDRGAVTSERLDEGRTRIRDVFRVSAPVSGILRRVEVEAGDPVRRGEELAMIAPAPPAMLDARLAAETAAIAAAARAGLSSAQARLDLAAIDQSRTALLAQRGFASEAALDAANTRLRAARAEVSAARAELARAEASAGGRGAHATRPTTVAAPAAGRVLRVFEESETIVAAGTPLIEIGDPADLEIVAEFLSQDAVSMRPGMAALIENWGGEGSLAGRVTRVEPFAHTKISALGVEEQRVNVVLRLDRSEEAPVLGHGFRVDVRVILSATDDALRAPVDALVRDGAGWSVWRIQQGRARRVAVELASGGGAFRAVSAGLREGDTIIIFPSEQLRDGQRVRERD